MYRTAFALGLTVLMLSACGGGDDDGNALMSPGQDCLGCHAAGGSASEHAFSVAGTVFPRADALTTEGIAGVDVVVVDSNDREVRMVSNAAGNFFTSTPLSMPLKSAYVVRNGVRSSMFSSATGACSACHALPPASSAPGRLFAN